MFTELIHLGFSNMAAVNKAVAVISPNSAPAKRLIQEGRKEGTVIDVTNGRRTKAILIMDSGHIILSPITPETIASRVITGRKSDLRGQGGEKEPAE
ncbi:extracellular matrix/biofilm biosynthesis regulator RemA family protein [Chloroflexota bacterium]